MAADGDVGFTKEEEWVAGTVKNWLGNPLSRSALRLVCGRSKHGNRLDIALRRYVGEEVETTVRDKLACAVAKFMINRGSRIFGVSGKGMNGALQDPVVRRGIVNVLEGIASFGVRRPYTGVAPFLVVWNFTKACNLQCKHCYEDSGPGRFMKDELTTEEAKRVVDELEEAGVVAVSFAGGEPLIRKDVFEVAKYAREKGFYTSIATNGTLITREMARKMRGVFQYAEISLDGFEETHDAFRGMEGSWGKACEGIRNCVAEGIDTCVALTATKYNLEEIPRLIDFVENELGAKRVIVFNYIPVKRGKEIAESDLSPQERHGLLKYLYSRMLGDGCRMIFYSTAPQYSMVSWEFAYGPVISTHFTNKAAMEAMQGKTKMLSEFLGGCGSGRLYCGLEPNGDVLPCVFMPIKLGNIREKSLKDIWSNSDVLKKLRDRENLEGCGECKYKYICGGCRARAYGYYGDVQGPDPGCIHNMRYWEELKAAAKPDERVSVKVYRTGDREFAEQAKAVSA